MKKLLFILFVFSITFISCSNEQEIKKAVSKDVWVLEWNTRDGMYSSDLNRKFELFLSKEDAEIRKKELKGAFKTVENTSEETNIKIYQQN